MIDKKACIWFQVIGLAVITGGYVLGKVLIPHYTVHKAHAITYFFLGLAMWLVPTKVVWFNRVARFLIIASINNNLDEFFFDPYTTQPHEIVLGVMALLSIFPVGRWMKRFKNH